MKEKCHFILYGNRIKPISQNSFCEYHNVSGQKYMQMFSIGEIREHLGAGFGKRMLNYLVDISVDIFCTQVVCCLT